MAIALDASTAREQLEQEVQIENLEKLSFQEINNKGGIAMLRAMRIGKMYFYGVLNAGIIDDDLLDRYLARLRESISDLRRRNNNLLIGGYDIEALQLADDFEIASMRRIGKDVGEIKGDTMMMSTELRPSQYPKPLRPIMTPAQVEAANQAKTQAKTNYLVMLNQMFRNFVSGNIPEDQKTELDIDNEYKETKALSQTISVPDIDSAIITMGYQMLERLPEEIKAKLPHDEETLNAMFLQLFAYLNPNNFPEKKARLNNKES